MFKKLKGLATEFKNFAFKGNVIDLAVGMIIGSAFTSVVNSLVNCSSATLAQVNGCERGIMTFVDSDISLAGNVLASVGNREGVNAITDVTVDPANLEAYKALYDGEMAMYFYGENVIDTADGVLSVNVAEGGLLTVYSANLTAQDITNTGAGELIVVTDPAYGTLEVK